MTDIFGYAGEANPKDIKASDPTVLRGGAGAQNLTATLFTNNSTFFTSSIHAVIGLVAVRFNNNQIFGSSVLHASINLVTTKFINAQLFGADVIETHITLVAAKYSNNQVFGSHYIYTTITLSATKYNNGSIFGASAINVSINLITAKYNNTQIWYNPSISTNSELLANCFENVQIWYNPIITQGLVNQFLISTLFNNISIFNPVFITTPIAPSITNVDSNRIRSFKAFTFRARLFIPIFGFTPKIKHGKIKDKSRLLRITYNKTFRHH